MSSMPSESIDLIYIDPPFFSDRNYELIWGDEAEISAFEDRWQGGINVYVDWIKHRVFEMHRLLKPTGTIFLHCDHHASHYLKVMMDETFTKGNFLNEIIWHYTGGGRSKKYLSRKHDSIFWYAKKSGYTFNIDTLRHPYKESSGYAKGGITSKNGKHYLPNPMGTPYDDVWDIPIINPQSKERLGYPTQKPEMLLERLISMASNPGDVILDCFCGCGTAIAVAEKMGRKWIGIDVSPTAVNITDQRMRSIGSDHEIIGMPKTVEDLKSYKPHDFQYWIITQILGTPSNKKVADMGIDGYSFQHQPIQVKQSEHVGRPVIDSFTAAIQRYNKNSQRPKKGIIIAFSFTRGAYDEVARLKKENVEIELMSVKDIIGQN